MIANLKSKHLHLFSHTLFYVQLVINYFHNSKLFAINPANMVTSLLRSQSSPPS